MANHDHGIHRDPVGYNHGIKSIAPDVFISPKKIMMIENLTCFDPLPTAQTVRQMLELFQSKERDPAFSAELYLDDENIMSMSIGLRNPKNAGSIMFYSLVCAGIGDW